MSTHLAVYVLQPTSRLRVSIANGSGIVGSPTPSGDRIKIDYEGNLYRAADLQVYANRVATAAGRHVTNYGTVARAFVATSELALVGFWDSVEGGVQVTDIPLLAAWLGVQDVPPAELLATEARYEQRRSLQTALRSPDPTLRVFARREAGRLGIDL